MGWFNRLFSRRTHRVGDNLVEVNIIDYSDVKTTPELRAVLDFRADAVASLPVRFYDDLTVKGNLNDLVPNSYNFLFDLVRRLDAGDTVVYAVRDGRLVDISDALVETNATDVVMRDSTGREVRLSYDDVAVFKIEGAQEKLASLKYVLAEQQYSREYRANMWKRSGQVGNYITRPAGVEWDEEAQQRFRETWSAFRNGGARAGMTPVLEDGMKIERFALSAHEEEWEASQRLAQQLICNVYNLPIQVFHEATTATALPSVRQYVYSDSLGGLISTLEASFETVARLLYGAGARCVIDIEERIAGSFVERAAKLTEAVGAPILRRNEARRYINLAPIEGGDELVTPLNVLLGGQVTPGGTPTTEHDNARAMLEVLRQEQEQGNGS